MSAPRNRLRRRAAGLAALALAAVARAQVPEPPACDADCANRGVADGWAGQTGEPLPEVRTGADGTRRLEWHGSLGLRAAHSRIQAGTPGSANTAQLPGLAGLATLQTELRLPELDGDAIALQLAAQAGSDRAAMPLYRAQVQNLAVSRQGPTSALQFGDYATSFSQLGLQLGYRGAYVHREFDGTKVAVIAGAIADSWDSLANRATLTGQSPRSRYIREVSGVHLGRDLGPQARVFASFSGYRDRPDSLPEDRRQMPAALGRTLDLGLAWRSDAFNASLEWARSRYSDDRDGAAHGSSGLIADAAWRFSRGQLRVGLRRIGHHFTSASQSVQPGLEEAFVAGDATAAAWLQLNADLRRTVQHTAATGLSEPSRTRTLRLQLGANATLGAWIEGLSANAQASLSDQHDPAGNLNRQAQTSLGVNWQRPVLNASLMLTGSAARTPANPLMDSDSHGLQAQLGLPFGNPRPLFGWTGQLSLTAGMQNQTLVAQPGTAHNLSAGLSLQAQREGLGQLGIALQEQASQPAGSGLRLRQRQFQLDAQRALAKGVDAKLYARWAWRNIGDPTLLGRERVIGAELQTRW